MPSVRQPAIFVPHGGGPCFWMDWPAPFGPHAWDGLKDYLASVLKSLPERPKAFLVVTAHWETDKPTVSVNPKPGMLYDYNGFPPHTYKLSYPAPGDPELAAEVKRLVEAAGLPIATDGERGFDHGVFVPFLIVDPKAEIPGRDAVAAQGPRSRLSHQARQGAFSPCAIRASRSSAAA